MWNQLLYLTCSCSDLLIEKRTIIVLLLIDVTLLLFYCSKLVLPQYQFSRKKRSTYDAVLIFLHLNIHSTKISSYHTRPLPEIAQLRCDVPFFGLILKQCSVSRQVTSITFQLLQVWPSYLWTNILCYRCVFPQLDLFLSFFLSFFFLCRYHTFEVQKVTLLRVVFCDL